MKIDETELDVSACFRHSQRPASAACRRCGKWFCEPCLPFHVGKDEVAVLCVSCGALVQQTLGSRVALGVVFVLFGVGAVWKTAGWATSFRHGENIGAGALLTLPLLVLVAIWIFWTSQRLRRRLRSTAWPQKANNALLSGKETVGVLLVSFVITALAVPFSLHLPRWIEVELVLGGWWLLGAGLLSSLLYGGYRISDDHVPNLAANPFAPVLPVDVTPPKTKRVPRWFDALNFDVGNEGCLVAFVVLAASLAAAWLVTELVAPLVFFAAYTLLVKAVGQVANDTHECEADLPRALGWGAWWSTVYLVPFALVVFLVHLWLRGRVGP